MGCCYSNIFLLQIEVYALHLQDLL